MSGAVPAPQQRAVPSIQQNGETRIRTAVITLASRARLAHAEVQAATLGTELLRYLVWLDGSPAPELGATNIQLPPGSDGLRLAAGRNAGAVAAIEDGAELLIFLDADCIAGPALVDRYRAASLEYPDAVLCGPVTYLPEGFTFTTAAELVAATAPHEARPVAGERECLIATENDYRLFWSLSFATTAFTWKRAGGFDDAYEGYGGEDTDFASRLAARRIPLMWVGGAHAYHQYHETSSPPWHNLDDILRNAALYHQRWGQWPMEGWLRAFAAAGAIEFVAGRWVRTATDSPSEGEGRAALGMPSGSSEPGGFSERSASSEPGGFSEPGGGSAGP